jgi:hypothetical protein
MSNQSTEEKMHEGTLREDGHHCDSGECWCWEDRYMVVRRETCDELIAAVNSFIHQKDWKPLGGIQLSVTHRTWMNERKGYQESDTDTCWAQAMVRHV